MKLICKDNNDFDVQVKKALRQGGGGSSSTATQKTTLPTSRSVAPQPASSPSVPEAILPTDFRDPREHARVERPTSFSIMQPERPESDRSRVISRHFRF